MFSSSWPTLGVWCFSIWGLGGCWLDPIRFGFGVHSRYSRDQNLRLKGFHTNLSLHQRPEGYLRQFCGSPQSGGIFEKFRCSTKCVLYSLREMRSTSELLLVTHSERCVRAWYLILMRTTIGLRETP